MDITNLVEEIRQKNENMLRFFAMEPTAQLEYLGKLPHDHGHPGFLENQYVIRFQRLMENFLESDPVMESPSGTRSGIELDMQYLLEREISEPNTESLWSEHGLSRKPMWRILRLLARQALTSAGVENIPPTVDADILCSR